MSTFEYKTSHDKMFIEGFRMAELYYEELKMNQIENEMKVAFDFLLTKKADIKNIIKENNNIYDVTQIICESFDDEYLSLYPDNYSIFNAINDSEFFEWCRENIEGFQGGEIERAPQYWCRIKE